MADDPIDAANAAAPPSPGSPADATSPESRLWAALREWRDAHIAGGPIARSTECWNHLEASLRRLAASILKEF